MKIALFLTQGMSLQNWHAAGLLHRDKLLYEYLADLGHEIWFVTYGTDEERDFLPADSRIQLLTRPKGLHQREYAWGIHHLHGKILSQVDVIKSHQVTGARFAAYAKWKLGKRYIARCGYLPSYFMAQEGASLGSRLRNWGEEFAAFHAADAICVPSTAEIAYLHKRYRIKTSKAYACPNWVDTDFFKPNPAVAKHPRRICFVGRFEPQKAPLVLLEAVRDIPDIELVMIGGGQLQEEIEAKIAAYGLHVQLLGRTPNEGLLEHYQRSAMYVLPTRYEGGSPKTLFEAMACGLPVVSTNGFGVNEAFQDGVQGYKVRVDDVAGVKAAIEKLLNQPELAQKMGEKARDYMIQQVSIQAALGREVAILEKLEG